MMRLSSALVAAFFGMLPLVAIQATENGKEKETAVNKDPAAGKTALVASKRLAAFLPEPPEGWKAERIEHSQTKDDDSIHITSASRSYYHGKGDATKDPVASITILDSLKNADYFDADEEDKWEKETKSDEGYDKRLMYEGMKVIEHYDEQARTGSLSVFVGNRFFVQIELTNENPAKLYDWLKRINIGKLAVAK